VFLLALAVRLFRYRSAYDVFLDETIYAGISDNVATLHRLTFEGPVDFYLHPPLLFFVDAVWLRLTEAAGSDPVALVWAARLVGCVFGAINAALLYAVVRRVAGSRTALGVGLAYVAEPFVIRFDTRVFLEAPTTTWLLAGYLVLLPLAGPDRGRTGLRRSCSAGLLFGLALLTKEPAAALLGLPLLVCLLRDRPVPRRVSATVLGAAVLTYLPYPVIATAVDGSQWFDQKTMGVQRLLGIVQETGFNRAGAPSFTGRLVAQLPFFGTTYAVMGLGLLAAVLVLRTRSAPQQLLALWGLSAFALLVYQVGLGTLEEQMFYFLVVPALAVVGIALDGLTDKLSPRLDRRVRTTAVVVLCLYAAFSVLVYARVHADDDRAVADTVRWMEAHVPPGGRVLALADGVQLVLPDYRVQTDPVLTSGAWAVTSSLQVEQGYGFARPADVRALRDRATPVFSTSGRSMGTLTVWRVP